MDGADELDPRVERSRARVLAAAAELVGTEGFGRVSIEAIAARSGVARSTIYRHWPKLSLLLMDAVRIHGEQMPDADTGRLRDDLVALFATLAERTSDPRARGMLAGVIAEAHRDDEAAVLNRTFSATRRERLIAVLARGRERGELPASIDLEQLADDLAAPFFFRVLIMGDVVDRPFVEGHVDRWLALAGAR